MLTNIEIVEIEELFKKLTDAGLGNFIDTFLLNENKVYTKKGRLNQSGACRLLKCKPKELKEKLDKCKEVIGFDLFD
jgi:hypothetical protein